MVANGDAHKPIWVTEMGWRTSAPNADDTWQVVTPDRQSEYIIQAFKYAGQSYPWLEKMALWQLNAQGDDYGYHLWDGFEQASQAYQALVMRCIAANGACQVKPEVQNSRIDTISILEADVTIRLGDQGTLQPHWVHLHRGGQNFSPSWQGNFFLSAAQAKSNYDLFLQTMQVDQPTNAIQINGFDLAHFQARTRPDPTSTWVTQRFKVNKAQLQPGHNTIRISAGQRNPAHQYSFWRWENFQFRNMRLVLSEQLPKPLLNNWQPLPTPGGWSETNRLRPGIESDFWLTDNRPGGIWRGLKTGANSTVAMGNQATNRHDLVFIDVLPTSQGQLAATHRGLFWRPKDRPDWEAVSDAPAGYSYVVAHHNNRFYAGFEEKGLWSAATPTGPWQPVGLSGLTLLDLAFGSKSGHVYAATNRGVYEKSGLNTDWEPLPDLPGDNQVEAGNPLKQFVTRIYVGQSDEIIVRNLDQFWRYWSTESGSDLPARWQPFGPTPLHNSNKLYSVLNCCGPGAMIGTKFSGMWQLSEEDSWERIDSSLFDSTDITELLQLKGEIYAAGSKALLQSSDTGQTWAKVESLPATLSDLLIDPTTPARWFVATAAGIYRSRDSGQTWQAVSPSWTVWDMAFDPDGRLFVGRANGIAWTDDLSEPTISWQETNGLNEVFFFNVDPYPSDSRVLVAGTWGNGLGLSYDSGNTMRSVHLGRGALSVLDVLWHPNEGQLTGGTIEGVYRTDNFGEDWFKLPGALKRQTVYSLLQTKDTVIWAGATNGLWFSQDYGATWQPVNTIPEATVIRLGQVALPDEDWLWAGTELSGLWLSKDQGQSWHFGGLAGQSIYSLQVDLLQPDRLIAATNRGLFAALVP
jgi:photosystem II stability/assembly factor-like uncharacterized protein